MKTNENTVLITGGGSGIGFETAKLFSGLGNTVILVGRNKEKLKAAKEKLNSAHYILADVTKEHDLNVLTDTVQEMFPRLNILMNNAGSAFLHNVSDSPNAHTFAHEEMETNYFAPVNLTNKLLPLLKKQENAAIINVSSIVALAPGLSLPTYSASKAALHSYTQALRLSLAGSNVRVFEVLPPLVDTEFAKQIASDKKISPTQVAQDLLQGLKTDNYEIHVASTKDLYQNFLSRADKAVFALNGLQIN